MTLLFIYIVIAAGVIAFLRLLKMKAKRWEIIVGFLYFMASVIFLIEMEMHGNPYYRAIDPVDMECYSPFSVADFPTLFFWFVLFQTSVIIVWTCKSVPPLLMVLCQVFLLIGVVLSTVVIVQLSVHYTETLSIYEEPWLDQILLSVMPLFCLAMGLRLMVSAIRQTRSAFSGRVYTNTFLGRVQHFVTRYYANPVFAILLLFPVFFAGSLILMLFGQDADSVVKVFTDTTTWRFSQHMHPPILDHQGHYLCTVATAGSPEVVKPLRLGKRHGRTIIVNRQLLIANAFEELIADISPKTHRIIRKTYDRYGLNISKTIRSERASNVVYRAMKPLEWTFLLCLYLCCNRPEEKISRQYQ